MAFPVIEGTPAETAVSTAGTSHAVNLPASIVSGELLLVLTNKGSGNTTFNELAGWTELLDEAVANGCAMWARQADGAEGATVTFTSAGNTRSASISFRISGAELLATQAPEITTLANGTSTAPDPGLLTPTGGAKDYLWIAWFGKAGEEADDDTWANTSPTDFLPSPPWQVACGIGGSNLGGMIGAASRSVNAASLDAAAFNVDVSTAWRAYTVAVHPATVVPDTRPITPTMQPRVAV